MKPIETTRNHIKSWFSQFLYKTKNMSQNLEHGLHVLKTQNPAKSETWFKESSKMIPKMSFYKIINLFGDDSRHPAISHKKCAVPNVNVLDSVGDFFGGIRYTLVLFHPAVYVFILGVPKNEPDLETSVSATKADPQLVHFKCPKFCL